MTSPFMPADFSPFLSTLSATLGTMQVIGRCIHGSAAASDREGLRLLSSTTGNRRLLIPNSVHFSPVTMREKKKGAHHKRTFDLAMAAEITGEDAVAQLENVNRMPAVEHEALRRNNTVHMSANAKASRGAKVAVVEAAIGPRQSTAVPSQKPHVRIVPSSTKVGSFERTTSVVVSDGDEQDSDEVYRFDSDSESTPTVAEPPPLSQFPAVSGQCKPSVVQMVDLIDMLDKLTELNQISTEISNRRAPASNLPLTGGHVEEAMYSTQLQDLPSRVPLSVIHDVDFDTMSSDSDIQELYSPLRVSSTLVPFQQTASAGRGEGIAEANVSEKTTVVDYHHASHSNTVPTTEVVPLSVTGQTANNSPNYQYCTITSNVAREIATQTDEWPSIGLPAALKAIPSISSNSAKVPATRPDLIAAFFTVDSIRISLTKLRCRPLVILPAEVKVRNISYSNAMSFKGKRCCFFDGQLSCLLIGIVGEVNTLPRLSWAIHERPPTFFRIDMDTSEAAGLRGTKYIPKGAPPPESIPTFRWVPFNELHVVPADARALQLAVLQQVRQFRLAHPTSAFTDWRCGELIAIYGKGHDTLRRAAAVKRLRSGGCASWSDVDE